MIPPRKHRIESPRQWRDIIARIAPELRGSDLVVVHTPSAASYVAENFAWADGHRTLAVRREPACEDFTALNSMARTPRVVIGIGGGKALDAAKAVAFWGNGYKSAAELGSVLATGGRIEQTRSNQLLLVPSLASSGSESSKAAILSVGGRKTGLRGAGLMADGVVYDERLWCSISQSLACHYAFDIFAHLFETTVSLRRTEQSLGFAAEGFARLNHWLFKCDASLGSYIEAMEAAYNAGLCLASASTCLPHRVQYVVGPATGTSHVEGIWFLSRPWLNLVEKEAPDRVVDAARMMLTADAGYREFRATFERIHARARDIVRRDRFKDLSEQTHAMARQVTGDLSADPCFRDRSTLEYLLSPSNHD